MKKIFVVLFLIVSVSIVKAQTNNSLSDDALLQIKFDQKTGERVSPDLDFTDETGKQIHMRNYFGSKPVILILGYYGCPMLCTLVLNDVTECLRNLKASAGRQFDVVFVSIDPTESYRLAAAKKQNYLQAYRREGSENGWHFLTGDQAAIQTLASQIGFHFAYDPKLKQFAHPSGFVVLTPDGKISRYFFGVTFSASEIDTALHDAQTGKTSSPVQELFLLCFHYSPFTGKYGKLVIDIVRIGGVVMVIGLGLVIFSQRGHPRTEKPR